MNRNGIHIDKAEFQTIATELLDAENDILLNSGGYSMFPILRPKDKLIIKRTEPQTLLKGEIIVCTINQKTIAHRLIVIGKKQEIIRCKTKGDNCLKSDPWFTSDAILGKVTGFVRNEKEYSLNTFSYRLFCFLILYFGFIFRLGIKLFFKVYKLHTKINQTLRNTISNLLLITKESKTLVFLNSLVAVLQGILPFAILYLLKRLIDVLTIIQTSHDGKIIFGLEVLIAITGFTFLLNLIINSTGTFIREKLSQKIAITIYNLLHDKHSQLDFGQLENPDQQDKIHRATVEAGFRPNKLVQACLSLMRSLSAGIIILVLMFSIHWALVIILTIGLFPGLLVRVRYSRKMYELNKTNSKKERQAYYYSRILTGIPFAKELRLFATASLFSSRFNSIQTQINIDKNHIYKKQFISEILSQSIAIILIFTAFGFVSNMALKGTITVGTVVLFFLVFQRGFVILKELFQAVSSIYEDSIFFTDFVSFLQLPSPTPSNFEINLPKTLQKGIRLESVSFSYPSSSRLALQNVTMEIPVGKTVALVGANGSGKTTLVKLLCGFYEPTQGSIFFDNLKCKATNQIETRNRITAVFQDFALYNMTASENIWLGNISKPLDLEKIKDSCSSAGISDGIKDLPQGYENMIGNFFEKGEELSIGQWQKMAIARAFYRDSDIILMDEPSSALDTETEKQLISSLQTLAKDKTVLIISHRFSTIQWADCIYVMDNGKIIESGNHELLMNKKGKYFEMYSLQQM